MTAWRTVGGLPLSEDFARWADDPITKLVLGALNKAADAQKAQWDKASWGGGIARPDDLARTLQELRVRADAYRSLAEMTFDDVTAWLGIDDAE